MGSPKDHHAPVYDIGLRGYRVLRSESDRQVLVPSATFGPASAIGVEGTPLPANVSGRSAPGDRGVSGAAPGAAAAPVGQLPHIALSAAGARGSNPKNVL